MLDGADCPVFQAMPVGSAATPWAASARGLSAADLAMQVALPEFDGRLGTIPVAFKAETADTETGLATRRLLPDPDGVAALADLVAGWIALSAKPVAARRLALVMSDYPARGGRAGFAVGLDTPASVAAIRGLLAEAGYDIPFRHCERSEAIQGDVERDGSGLLRCARNDGQTLMAVLTTGPADLALPLDAYRAWLETIPADAREALLAAHGAPMPIRPSATAPSASAPSVTAPSPSRCSRRAMRRRPTGRPAITTPDAPPSHGYLAFYRALRETAGIDALIHLGTHGTTEWLPGKAVALSASCWPRLVTQGCRWSILMWSTTPARPRRPSGGSRR